MFSLLAILAIVLTVAVLPIFAAALAALFVCSNRDGRESEKDLQAIAVRVEKYQNSWRARHQTRTGNCSGSMT